MVSQVETLRNSIQNSKVNEKKKTWLKLKDEGKDE